MLKIYDKLDDVPEALREHYKLIEGKYVPEVSDDHPVKVNNVKLLNEKTAAETKASGLETANTGLKADLESAKSHSLPRGHRAVPVAEIEALEKMKEHGTATEITAKLAEHSTLKADATRRATEDNLRLAAKELGYNEDAFIRLPNLPEFEIREANGKKTVVAKLKDAAGTITEKPAADFIASSADIAPFLPALTAKAGVRFPTSGGGNEPVNNDIFKSAREFGENWNKSQPTSDVKAAFGITT